MHKVHKVGDGVNLADLVANVHMKLCKRIKKNLNLQYKEANSMTEAYSETGKTLNKEVWKREKMNER